MKITKRQLKRIVREACGDLQPVPEAHIEHEMHLEPQHWDIAPNPEFGGAPCPYDVAGAIRDSEASNSDTLNWLQTLIKELIEPEEDFHFTGDVGEFPGDAAFGIGYE